MAVVMALLGSVPFVAGGGAGAEPGDSATIDLLQADVEAVREAIAKTERDRAKAVAALDSTNAELQTAREAEAAAAAAVEVAERAVAEADEAVAVAVRWAYASSSLEIPSEVAYLLDKNEGSYRMRFLEHRAMVLNELLEEQARARRALERERNAAAEARAEVEFRRDRVEELIAALDEVEENQVRLAAIVEDRLDAALAEAEALRALDEAVAAELVAREQELHDAAVASLGVSKPSIVPVSDTVPAPTPPTTAKPAPPPTTAKPTPTTAKPTPTTAKPTPTTAKPTPTTLPAGTTVDVVHVRGIPVARSIASNLESMMAAAQAAGFTLGGSGYRDINVQINLRIQNCGGSDYYSVWQKPSSQCNPPTAIPGRSMHEKGLAVDLTCNGSLIRSQSSACFQWLKANASKYGFYNLPSEPWHWSTNGN